VTALSPCPVLPSLAAQYEVVELLRRGQGIDTVLARDRRTGDEVIIKTASARSVSSVAGMRLEHEADVLRRVSSSVLTPVLEFGRDGDLLYLVMPRVPGVTLEQVLVERALSAREALTVGMDVLRSLAAAHAEGILHRDVKPANVIVDGGVPISRATLIDFGLARSDRLGASIRDRAVGTAQYVSPEQAGLLGEGVDECSDLYALGVLLFRCLAGRLPFLGDTVGDVLRQHLSVPPPRLRELVSVPRAIDEVVQHLLRKDPRDRYQGALAVLADLEEIVEAVDRGIEEPALVVGLHDRRRTITEPACGRRSRPRRTAPPPWSPSRRSRGVARPACSTSSPRRRGAWGRGCSGARGRTRRRSARCRSSTESPPG
jgi:serine/threonine protein kinase